MNRLNRREFFQASVVGTTLGSTRLPLPSVGPVSQALPAAGPVHFSGDGLILSHLEYAHLLVTLAAENGQRDSYMSGGAVERLEQRFAQVLGKERAVFVPTGTLANHLAIRHLAQQRSRVLVHAESHIYSDSLDACKSIGR